ncbi:MAG TPA: sigma factor [Acidimicrobiales bacterium]|nr:sigma factor [Acidimicrobiales bacterium]
MEQRKHVQLVEVMARMAEGDRAAVFTLYAEFGTAIAAVMRRELARLGRYGVEPDDLDGLVIDACLELARLARAWDPERGAAPWTWAMRRLTRLASDFVGIHADPLDEAIIRSMAWSTDTAGTKDPPPHHVLERLAPWDPACRLLLEALAEVSTPRNRDILLEVRLQASLGDPAPAVTVGRSFGLRPDAVRQVVKRTRDAIGRLAAEDPKYAPLAAIPLVA